MSTNASNGDETSTGYDSSVRGAASRVLLSAETTADAPGLIPLAHAVADADGSDILVADVAAVPRQTPLGLSGTHLDSHRELLRRSVRAVDEADPGTPVEGLLRIGRDQSDALGNVVETHGVTTVVTGDDDRSDSLLPFRRSRIDRLRAAASCSVVAAAGPLDDVSSILVPVAGGPHSGRAIDVALALARRHDAWIDLLHVVEPDASLDTHIRARTYFEAGEERLGDYGTWDTWVLEADDVARAIVEQSAYYDATVLGAPQKGRLRRFVSRSTTADVQADAENAVLTVWDGATSGSR